MTFTPEEITAMAKEAGMDSMPADYNYREPYWACTDDELRALVALVAAKEREACATLVELGPPPITGFGSRVEIGFGARTAFAAAIRARGQKGGV